MKTKELLDSYWANREKLLKDGRYVIYEDDKIVLFQEGKGYDPYYMIKAFVKETKDIRHIDKCGRSVKFAKYWHDYISKGERLSDIVFVVGEDFKFRN